MFRFWSSFCFLSWRIGVKGKQKEAVSRLQKDFPTCGSSLTPVCIFKRYSRRILSTPALSGRNILVLSALSEILKLTPHHEHMHLVNKVASLQLVAFADFFGVREEFFCPAFIQLNLVTALSWFREQCSLEDCLEIHNSIAMRNWYHISPIWQFFSPGEIANWFDSWWRQNSATTVEHETEWSCYRRMQ